MARILVIYYSASGNTRKMAELVAEGASAAGGHDVKTVPVEELSMTEFTAADGYAFGSPDYFTYMAGQMKTFFDQALAQVGKIKDKPFVSFVTHGGGGDAILSLDKLGSAIGLKKVCEGVKSRGAPVKGAIEESKALGEKLAKAVV